MERKVERCKDIHLSILWISDVLQKSLLSRHAIYLWGVGVMERNFHTKIRKKLMQYRYTATWHSSIGSVVPINIRLHSIDQTALSLFNFRSHGDNDKLYSKSFCRLYKCRYNMKSVLNMLIVLMLFLYYIQNQCKSIYNAQMIIHFVYSLQIKHLI